jgi:hypothetical protein
LLSTLLILACTTAPVPPATGEATAQTAPENSSQEEQQGQENQGEAQTDTVNLNLTLTVPLEMPTVVHASWQGTTQGEVFYDDGQTLRRAKATATADGYEAWLFGASPGSEVVVWVEGVENDRAFASEEANTTTSKLEQDLLVPDCQDLSEAATMGDLVLVAFSSDDNHGVALYNGAGETVWAWQAEPGHQVSGTSWCGTGPCVLLQRGQERLDDNLVLQLGPTGETLRTIEASHAHHDVAMDSDGAIYWLQADPRETDEHGLVYGDQLIRSDTDGSQDVLWSSWETLDVEPGTQWEGRYYQDGRDWTHANGIFLRDGNWLVSLGGQATILEIDGETGEILRTLEGQDPELGDARFDMQHSPSWTPDGNLLLFVNEGPGGSSSWVAEFAVDGDTLTEVWHTDRDGPLATDALGHTWRREDGRTLVDFGQIPVVQQLDVDGQPQWELEFAAGTWTTQVRPVDDFTVR